MKRTIVIEILLLIAAIAMIACCVQFFVMVANDLETIEWFKQENQEYLSWYRFVLQYSIFGSLSLLATLADLAAMVLIALRDIPKLKAWIEQRKAARKVAKAEKAEADKQTRIAMLQAELDQLKKDE